MTLVCHCAHCRKQLGTSFSVIVAVAVESLDDATWLKPKTPIGTDHWQPWVAIPDGATTAGRNPSNG